MHQDSKYCNLSNWTKEIHYNTNEKDIAHIPYNRTILQNSFIYFAFHPDPPLSNCHDLTCQAADSNAMQMQPCNFVTKIKRYFLQTPYILLRQLVYLYNIFLEMVYILFPYWNVLPKAHFTKEPSRQILGKQFLHRSYPWTISRLTPTFEQFADSLLPLNNFQTHCMFIVVQLHPQHKQKSVYRVQNFACQRLLWAFCFPHLKQCIKIFRKMCFEVWLKNWVTEVGGGTWLGCDLQNGNF